MRKITHIILHHAAHGDVKKGISYDTTEEQINQWHIANGWNKNGSKTRTTGYQYVVRKTGEIEVGRKEWEVGAHAPGWNSKSIGICHSGHFDIDGFTPEQLESSLTLTASLMKKHNIPIENVLGHGEVRPTDCPGKLFDLDKYRSMLKERLKLVVEEKVDEEGKERIKKEIRDLYNIFSELGVSHEPLNKFRNLPEIKKILD